MKLGDKVTNIGIIRHKGNNFQIGSLIGKITKIGKGLYFDGSNKYKVNIYTIQWPNFSDWYTKHIIKKIQGGQNNET